MARNNNKGKTITKLYSPTENTIANLSSFNLLHKHFNDLLESKNIGIIEIDLNSLNIIWTKEALELLKLPISDAPHHLEEVLRLLSKRDRATLLPKFKQMLDQPTSTNSFKFHIPERNLIIDASVVISKPTVNSSQKCIVTLSIDAQQQSTKKKVVNDLDFVQLIDYERLFEKETVEEQSFNILFDTSNKIQSMKLLDEHDNILSGIEQTLPGLIFIYDVRSNSTLYINKNIEQLLGYTIEELRAFGNDYLEKLTHPEDHSNFYLWSQEARGVIKESKFRLRSKSGKWIWILSKGGWQCARYYRT
jgi:PAS domain S-box-containing protein